MVMYEWIEGEKNCLSKNFTTDQTPEMFLSQLSYVKKSFLQEMKHIHEIEPSRYHLNHVLSLSEASLLDPSGSDSFPEPGLEPSLSDALSESWSDSALGTPAGSPSQSLRSGSALTAGTRCLTVRSLRACVSWPGWSLSESSPVGSPGPPGSCRPRCRTCSGCLGHSRRRSLLPWLALI